MPLRLHSPFVLEYGITGSATNRLRGYILGTYNTAEHLKTPGQPFAGFRLDGATLRAAVVYMLANPDGTAYGLANHVRIKHETARRLMPVIASYGAESLLSKFVDKSA